MKQQVGLSVKKKDDFSEWYSQVILKAGLIEHTKVSGCMIIRPYAYAIWERIVAFMDSEFKKLGVSNAYFPLFIPESLLKKEASHLEGFSPEVAWVTHGGNSKLSERLAVRPTSETIMYEAYSKWIRSHRDLPLVINQWCNVVRWEFKHPVPFLRTREFLWQEGHSAHSNSESAKDELITIMKLYNRVYQELLGIYCASGEKSSNEKFAGADFTLSLETLFPNGKAIQACTGHFLGQNFSKAFDITFLDEDQNRKFVYQTSWGFTTRSLGIMIGVHGDDKGLILPPSIAPINVVVVPILFSKKDSDDTLEVAKNLAVANNWYLDDRKGYSPGYKFSEWELKGVPIRIEVGPRDVAKQQVIIVRRDTGEKIPCAINKVSGVVDELLSSIQLQLFNNHKSGFLSKVIDVNSLDELKQVVNSGCIARAFWCGDDEELIRAESGAKSLNGVYESGVCFLTKKKASMRFLFGKSY